MKKIDLSIVKLEKWGIYGNHRDREERDAEWGIWRLSL